MAVNELELRRRKIIASQPHLETVSGAVATFIGERFSLKSCKASIEPVQAGSGDPSPDNVRPITGWTGAKVTRTGKNLLNPSGSIVNCYLSAKTQIYPGSIAILRASAENRTMILPVAQNTEYAYTWNRVYTGDYADDSNISLFKEYPVIGSEGVFTSINISNGGTILFNTGAYNYIAIKLANVNRRTDLTETIRLSQLELGATATAYEPYSGKTVDVQFPTEAGTVYGGSLDVTNGVLTVNRAMVDLGTLDWYLPSAGYFSVPNTINCNPAVNQWIAPIGICDRYKVVPSHYVTVQEERIDKSITWVTAQIRIADSGYSDATSFKESLEGSVLVYELATPITYQLTPQEITTLIGTNNVWADTGDVSVTYWKH